MKMQFSSRTVGDVVVVQCSGRLVAGEEAQTFQDHVRRELIEIPFIVLNARELEFVDSSGLGAIVRLMSAARAEGGDLKLCHLPTLMRKSIEMTNLHRVLEIYENESDAIVACCSKRKPADGRPPHVPPAILCVGDTPEIRAYLGELLRRAGLSVLTTGNLADAQVLLKAGKLRLIVANEKHAQALGRVCGTVPILQLADNFSTHDAGEAGADLLAQIKKHIEN
jgi:anti-anti-sigma factor